MDVVHDLGPVPQRRTVDVTLAASLVAAQFPQWAHLPITPVPRGGWDNWTFRLGEELVLRLPSAAEYAQAVAKEQRWLPVLERHLPLPIPVTVGAGQPTDSYPFAWSIYRWLDGNPLTPGVCASPYELAIDLAGFLRALRSVAVHGGPAPGIHNWFRGGSLLTFAPDVERCLAALRGRVDVESAGRVWQGALDARWGGIPAWFHGDVAAGNLLLGADGRLCAVIDFGTCGVGDPACDVAAAWTLLTDEGRDDFRRELGVDEAEWWRGRGWALWKALVTCSHTWEDPDDRAEFDAAAAVIDAVVRDLDGS